MNRCLSFLSKIILVVGFLSFSSCAFADLQSLSQNDAPSSSDLSGISTPSIPKTDSLKKRVYDDEELLKWARKVIVAPCSFTSENYDEAHKAAKGYFLPKAWVSVQRQLACYGDRYRFIKRKNLLQCTMTGKLQILRKGTMKGVYAWYVAVPMRIVSLHHSAANVMTSMLITRYPFKRSSDGLAVRRYYMTIHSVG